MRVFVRFILVFGLSLSLFVFTLCKTKQNSSREKEFRLQITKVIKKMNRRYKKTTKKLTRSKNPARIVKIIRKHLTHIHKMSKTMLLLEIDYPKLFDKQEKKPPEISQTLRNSIEKFSLVMTKLAAKHKKNKSFLNSYQQVFGATKVKDQIVVDVYSSVTKSQKIEYQNIIEKLKQWTVRLPSENLKENLKKFMSSVKKNKEKQQRLNLKYSDIVHIQKKKHIQDVSVIKKKSLEIIGLLDALFKKKGGKKLKNIVNDIKLVLID